MKYWNNKMCRILTRHYRRPDCLVCVKTEAGIFFYNFIYLGNRKTIYKIESKMFLCKKYLVSLLQVNRV